MEQLVILLIIGGISLVNWLMQRSSELREKRKLEQATQRGEMVPAPESQEEPPDVHPAESMRKLMEALGLPMEEAPPAIPKRVEPPPAAPPPMVREVPRPRHRASADWSPTEPAVTATREPLAPVAPLAPLAPVFHSQPAPPAPPSRLRELLSSTSGLRDAVVLSEILGKPRSQI